MSGNPKDQDRKKLIPRRGFLSFLSASALSSSRCSKPTQNIVFLHAGSLTPLIRELSQRFESNNPHTRILSEPSGSLDAVRKITELGKHCDIIATADHRLLSQFIVPIFSDRYYKILGNEIVLATARPDIFSSSPKTWSQEWRRRIGQLTFGLSDPVRDPAGYFTHLVWKLAEIHYQSPGLYRHLVSRIDQRWIRPKSSELIALLQTNHLDTAFIYRSTAIQHKLKYVLLPPQISLGDPAYASHYKRVTVRIGSKKNRLEIAGAPIRSGIALLSPDNTLAQNFLNYMLTAESTNLLPRLGYTRIPVQEISP